MSPLPAALPDAELEAALRDLGTHLDLGSAGTPAGQSEIRSSILDRLGGASTTSRSRSRKRRPRRLVAAAAVVVLGVAGLLAVSPTRDAIADWLGIGAVRIAPSDDPPPIEQRDGEPESVDPDTAARSVRFALKFADPARSGAPLEVTIDPAVPAGLVEIRYADFTLVQVASMPGSQPSLDKTVGPGTTVTPVTVGDRRGFWLAGEPHGLSYVRPDGQLAQDTVRRAGNVLVWEDADVTYRIEGAESLDEALFIASSLR